MRSNTKILLKFYSRKARVLVILCILNLAVLLADFFNKLKRKKKHEKKRILVIIFGGLGDCLLFDVLLRRIRENYIKQNEHVEIDVLTGSFEEMWQHSGSADNILIFSRFSYKFPVGYFKLFYQLRQRQYDIAIEGIAMLPRRSFWSVLSGLFIKATKAPEKIIRENTGLLHVADMPFAGFKSSVQKTKLYFDVLKSKENNIINLPNPNQRKKHEAYYVAKAMNTPFYRNKNEPCLYIETNNESQYGLDANKKKIAVLIETTYPLKAWPEKSFIELIERLTQNEKIQIVLIGVEPLRAQFIQQLPNADIVNLSAQTNLTALMQVLKKCTIFIGADTGPAHVAQALGVPSIVLFGPSNENEFGPGNTKLHSVVLPQTEFECRPCVLGPCIKEESCMYSISVGQVYNMVIAKLESNIKWHPANRYTRPKISLTI